MTDDRRTRLANMNSHDIAEFIKQNISRHKLCSVATIDGTGMPWVVCVAFTLDEQFNVIWRSLKDTEHSKHIQAHPDVALGIFSDTEDVGNFGLYMKAKAHEVTDDEELKHLISIRSAHRGKPMPDVSELLGDAPARLYYAEVTEAWLNDDSHTKKPVDLNLLRHLS